MSSSRQKAKPVFDPHALDQDLEELWPLPQSRTPPPVAGTDAVTEPAAPPPAHSAPPIEHAPARSATAPTASPMPSTSGGQVDRRRRLASVSASSSPARKRFRPPEVLLSAEVYDELYRVQIAEKKVRRGLARTMGAIVLDAIEAHATRLATTWADQRFAVGEVAECLQLSKMIFLKTFLFWEACPGGGGGARAVAVGTHASPAATGPGV